MIAGQRIETANPNKYKQVGKSKERKLNLCRKLTVTQNSFIPT